MDKRETKNNLENISIIHLYICKKLSENFCIDQPITYKYLINQITRMTYHMPRKYDDIVIKELMNAGFITKISGGRTQSYTINKIEYDNLIKGLDKLKDTTQRFKILKGRYNKLLELIEKEDKFEQKYNLLKCDFEKILRKKELKQLEENHYW